MQNTDIIEIERRWIVPEIPREIDKQRSVRRHQAYTSGVRIVKRFDFSLGVTDERLLKGAARLVNDYQISVKGEGTLSRPEWEATIPEWVYNTLLKKTDSHLDITRHFITYYQHILEIDEYHADLIGLIKIECEFKSEDHAKAFVLPEWMDKAIEVTDNPAFNNSNLVGKTYSDVKQLLK